MDFLKWMEVNRRSNMVRNTNLWMCVRDNQRGGGTLLYFFLLLIWMLPCNISEIKQGQLYIQHFCLCFNFMFFLVWAFGGIFFVLFFLLSVLCHRLFFVSFAFSFLHKLHFLWLHVKSWSSREEKHIRCSFCQLKAWNHGYNSHNLAKTGWAAVFRFPLLLHLSVYVSGLIGAGQIKHLYLFLNYPRINVLKSNMQPGEYFTFIYIHCRIILLNYYYALLLWHSKAIRPTESAWTH